MAPYVGAETSTKVPWRLSLNTNGTSAGAPWTSHLSKPRAVSVVNVAYMPSPSVSRAVTTGPFVLIGFDGRASSLPYRSPTCVRSLSASRWVLAADRGAAGSAGDGGEAGVGGEVPAVGKVFVVTSVRSQTAGLTPTPGMLVSTG